MKSKNCLVDNEYLLQKFTGKGGWTYAEIPEIAQNKNNPFGWEKVKGSIDGYTLIQSKLMPMGNGKLFLPVKAQIRKVIKKQAGDFVKIVLFVDDSPYEIPQEIKKCFSLEAQELYETFKALTDGECKAYLDWIYGAKSEDTKARRIVSMMDRLRKNLKYYDKEDK